MKLKIDEENGFKKFLGVQILDVEYPTFERLPLGVKFGDTVTFDLDAYQQLVAELHAGGSPQANPPPPAGPEISFGPARLRGGVDLKVLVTVDVPAIYRQARVAVLLEPDQEIRGVKAEALDAGKPLRLSVENGGRGIWYWYYADLTPGRHSIELTIHSASPAHISAWLLTRRDSSETSQTSLPAHNIERSTHLLLEETIR